MINYIWKVRERKNTMTPKCLTWLQQMGKRPQRSSEALVVWEGRGGDLILRSLKWLWVEQSSRNVHGRDSYMVLKERKVAWAQDKDVEGKSTEVLLDTVVVHEMVPPIIYKVREEQKEGPLLIEPYRHQH